MQARRFSVSLDAKGEATIEHRIARQVALVVANYEPRDRDDPSYKVPIQRYWNTGKFVLIVGEPGANVTVDVLPDNAISAPLATSEPAPTRPTPVAPIAPPAAPARARRKASGPRR